MRTKHFSILVTCLALASLSSTISANSNRSPRHHSRRRILQYVPQEDKEYKGNCTDQGIDPKVDIFISDEKRFEERAKLDGYYQGIVDELVEEVRAGSYGTGPTLKINNVLSKAPLLTISAILVVLLAILLIIALIYSAVRCVAFCRKTKFIE